MNKTTDYHIHPSERLTVNTNGLAQMLGCGRATAVKIGDDAGARIYVGKRVIWNIRKVQEYIDSQHKSIGGNSHGL